MDEPQDILDDNPREWWEAVDACRRYWDDLDGELDELARNQSEKEFLEAVEEFCNRPFRLMPQLKQEHSYEQRRFEFTEL